MSGHDDYLDLDIHLWVDTGGVSVFIRGLCCKLVSNAPETRTGEVYNCEKSQPDEPKSQSFLINAISLLRFGGGND